MQQIIHLLMEVSIVKPTLMYFGRLLGICVPVVLSAVFSCCSTQSNDECAKSILAISANMYTIDINCDVNCTIDGCPISVTEVPYHHEIDMSYQHVIYFSRKHLFYVVRTPKSLSVIEGKEMSAYKDSSKTDIIFDTTLYNSRTGMYYVTVNVSQ